MVPNSMFHELLALLTICCETCLHKYNFIYIEEI